MRIITGVLLFLGCSCLALAQAGQAGPGADVSVPNGGMEQGTKGPADWTWGAGEGGKGDFEWETAVVHGGSHSFRVKDLRAVGYTMLSSSLVPVEPGRTYLVTAWIYPFERVRGGVYFMIGQYRPRPGGGEELELPNTFGPTFETFQPRQWQELSVRVAVREGNTRLCIQCIQAGAPSDICWDDFAVSEAGALPPPRYEKPAPEPLPPLAPAEAEVSRRARARAQVEVQDGRPRLIVDGKLVPWAFYVSPFWNPQDAQIADFEKAGVRVYLVPLVLGHGVYGDRGPWLGKGRYDFSGVDALLWRVLRVDPQGYILFYLACDPYRDWGAENPEDVTEDQKGLKAIVDMHPKRWGGRPGPGERYGPCPVSAKLRQDVGDALRALVAHVEASEAGRAVIGYQIGGFNDGQWFQWDDLASNPPHLADYCPAAERSFREWLRQRYGNDVDALRRAWNRPDVTFDTAQVPPFSRYWARGVLLDPRTQQDIADYTRFYSEGVADTVLGLAKVIKQATPRPVICGTYYEDITGGIPDHIALGHILASGALDYLAGPAAYGIRMPGYPGAVKDVFGSTLLHGKTYLTEQDWRSWLSAPDSPENNFAWGRAENAEQSNAMVWRESGMMLAFGLGTWWYDMGGGWFHDPQIMAGIAKAVGAFRRDLTVGGLPRGDLAVFVSERSNDYVAPREGGVFRYGGIVSQIHELNVAGVPYRLYLQSDLGRVKLPEHRAYLFLNPYFLSPEQKQAIDALKRDGKLLIFVQAPGAVGAADPAAEVSAVTGISVRPATGLAHLASVGESGQGAGGSASSLLSGLGGAVNMSTGLPPTPAFQVVDPKAQPLARYSDNSEVAIAARDFGTWKSVFVGTPGLTAGFLQNLARWAGCWCVAKPGDAVYANEHFLTIHAIFDGHKVLRLAGPSRVTDLTSGRVVAEDTDQIEVDMKRGETRWFYLEPR